MAISLLCLQMVCQRGPLAPPQDPVGESFPFERHFAFGRVEDALASRASCITRGRGGWLNLPRGGLPPYSLPAFLAHSEMGPGCVKTCTKPRMPRIVFSIAFFRQKLPVRSVSTSTKSRWKFYTQVRRESFHTAWGQSRRSDHAPSISGLPAISGQLSSQLACLKGAINGSGLFIERCTPM